MVEDVVNMNLEGLKHRIQFMNYGIKTMRSEVRQINARIKVLKDRTKANNRALSVRFRIDNGLCLSFQRVVKLPFLVANVVEILELDARKEDGASIDLDAAKTICAVIKTTTRMTFFIPSVDLVDPKELKPGDLVGVNKVIVFS